MGQECPRSNDPEWWFFGEYKMRTRQRTKKPKPATQFRRRKAVFLAEDYFPRHRPGQKPPNATSSNRVVAQAPAKLARWAAFRLRGLSNRTSVCAISELGGVQAASRAENGEIEALTAGRKMNFIAA
jgi:hypothetical protein